MTRHSNLLIFLFKNPTARNWQINENESIHTLPFLFPILGFS